MPRQVDASARPEDGPQDVSQDPDSIVESEVPDADEVDDVDEVDEGE
jgi:hypothetical protein